MLGFARNVRTYDVSSLFSLLIRCPYGIDTNQACPFHRFRKLDELQKFELADNMRESYLQKLLSKHYDCYYGRKHAV